MADPFNVIAVPVVTIDVENAIPAIEVTIDKTGPAGSGTVDDIARSQLSSHTSDASDPHGAVLTQTAILTTKATVGITNAGTISTSQAINFANCGCYVCTATGVLTLTVSSLGIGQRGSIHILSGVTPPTISWTGVGLWIGGQPTFVAGKLTVVTLFNDGTRIIGGFGVQA
jgi:hypothetical protein